MNFSQLQERLRNELRRLIGRGEESVSNISRKTGLGQAHISNFLRGKGLLVGSLDQIVDGLGLDLGKLAGPERAVPEVGRGSESRRIPVVSAATAMWEAQPGKAAIRRVISVPAADLAGLPSVGSQARLRWRRFVAVEVSAREAAGMEPVIYPGAVLVLDRHYNSLKARDRLGKDGAKRRRINLYLAREGSRLVIRYAYFAGKKLVLKPFKGQYLTTFVEVDSRLAAMELLAGRVAFVWMEPESLLTEVEDLEEDGG